MQLGDLLIADGRIAAIGDEAVDAERIDAVAQIVMQAGVNEVEAVFVAGEAVNLGGELVDSGARRAARLAVESRERIVAALEPRGGFLPPAPEGWFDATLDAFEANLAGAPEA